MRFRYGLHKCGVQVFSRFTAHILNLATRRFLQLGAQLAFLDRLNDTRDVFIETLLHVRELFFELLDALLLSLHPFGAELDALFFESAAFNTIALESDAKTRMDYIEQCTPVSPKSKFDEQVASYAMLSLSQLKDNKRLNSYAEKALAANANNIPALLLLANAYVDSSEPGGAANIW